MRISRFRVDSYDEMKTRIPATMCAIDLAVLLCLAPQARGQETPPAAPDTAVPTSRETYRLRVENARYGRIELSIDNGEHFLLIGRVVKPATVTAPTTAVQAGSIVRSSGDGLAFTVATGQMLKILPATNAMIRGKAPDSVIVTDLKPHTGLFGDVCPPTGTSAMQQTARGEWKPFPNGVTPTEDDTFGFVVVLPLTHGASGILPLVPDLTPIVRLAKLAEVRKKLTALSEQYTGQALARARESKRSIVSGVVILRAKLPTGEPEPITAVTYSIDGDTVSAQTTLPSAYGWDTTRAANGEHIVEIRALSKYATVITRVRVLVLVDNTQADSHAAP